MLRLLKRTAALALFASLLIGLPLARAQSSSDAPGPSAAQTLSADEEGVSRGTQSAESNSNGAPTRSTGKAPARSELSEVVVTGTRIAGAIPTSPVTTIDRSMIEESGYASIGQLLLAIPQNFSGGQNPGVIGARGNNQFTISGAYSPNIHGLGADSTLTLIDGHRFAYDGYQNGVDLSVIPLAAIDHVEILTDGASALYGSDAVAGVVNVILKQHYDGLAADARYGTVTTGHSAREQYSVLGGHDWSSGNAMLAYEYSHSDPLYAADRTFSAQAAQPTSLLPELNRNSVYATLHQELRDGVTGSVEGLYTARSYVQAIATGNTENFAELSVRQYGVSPSIAVSLPGQWTVTVEGILAGDRDDEISPAIDATTGRVKRTGRVSYSNQIRLGEIRGTGPLLELPSGPVELAAGAGYRNERFSEVEPSGSSVPSFYATRNVGYAYGEMQVPLIKPDAARTGLNRLDLNGAFRYEHYSDFGGQSTPKIGLVYAPAGFVHVRGTWSKSFRAPQFVDISNYRQLYAAPAAALGGIRGTTALYTYGANSALGPETAESETVGLDLLWPERSAFRISSTYFHVDYRNRIVQPIDNLLRGLSNPRYAPFVTLNPPPAELQALFAQAAYFANFTGAPYDPANVSALLNDTYQNASEQTIHGLDLTMRDRWPVLIGNLGLTAGATWLTIRQRTSGLAPEAQITGTVFNPPKLKARASVNWRHGGWGVTATYNYVDGELDDTGTNVVPVSSWSTVDAQLSYDFASSIHGVLRGLTLSLSVQNLFDRDPPLLDVDSTTYPGLRYDSANASPLGRFVSIDLAKRW